MHVDIPLYLLLPLPVQYFMMNTVRYEYCQVPAAKQSFYLFLELRLYTPFSNSELVGMIQNIDDNANKFHAKGIKQPPGQGFQLSPRIQAALRTQIPLPARPSRLNKRS